MDFNPSLRNRIREAFSALPLEVSLSWETQTLKGASLCREVGVATGLQGFPLDWGKGVGVGSCTSFEHRRDLVKVKFQEISSDSGTSLGMFDE